jgi:hypothetical protein
VKDFPEEITAGDWNLLYIAVEILKGFVRAII